MKTIKVNLGKRSYNIYVGYSVLPRLKNMIGAGKGMIVTDDNVKRFWGGEIKRLNLPVYSIKPGERSKTLKTAERIYKEMLRYGLDRHSYLIAFGGGVVGDLAGFAAATYKRGILYVQVPTTVMAQVDSGIGGKTGVDLPEGKNLVGCFWQPRFVFIDVKLLSTLPKKEIRSGLAEVVKYGIIKSKRLFEFLEINKSKVVNIEPKLWMPIILDCAKIKADVVSRDEMETTGLRVILNYGHTIGHAIETSSNYRNISHGEAVAFGMIAAAKLANRMGYLPEIDMDRQIALIKSLTLHFARNAKCKVREASGVMRHDKKAVGGKLRFVLADRIGHVFVTDKVKEKDVEQVLREL